MPARRAKPRAERLGDALTEANTSPRPFLALVEAIQSQGDEPELEAATVGLSGLLRAAIKAEGALGRYRQSAALQALHTVLEQVRIALPDAIEAAPADHALGYALGVLAGLI